MNRELHMTTSNSITSNANTVIDSIPKLVLAAAERHGDLTAIEDGELIVSYKALPNLSLEVCRALMASGINPGDRVAIWGANSGLWVLAAIGLQMAGAVLVPINTRMKAVEGDVSGALTSMEGTLVRVQERLNRQIMVALQTLLETEDVAVRIQATHYCVKSRGVMDTGSSTQTLALGGVFSSDPARRREFLA